MVKPAFHGSITASTLGQANPSHLTEGTSWRHQGRPPGWPLDPATHDDPGDSQAHKGGAEARRKERLRKLGIFIAARAEGLDIIPAGERAGVLDKTAYRYEADRKARLAAQADGATS